MIEFSICLPVRNGFPYIKECVNSILGQSYPHFKLHVLDNNSTDDTIPWVSSLSDPRIQIFRSSTSLSITESWKRIKNIEKLSFMTLIGHDDVMDPGFLAAIKELIAQHPNAGLYSTSGRLINSNGSIIRSCKPVARIETSAEYLKKRYTFQCDVFGTGYVMRSADYDRLDGIPSFERLFFADDALWLSLMHNSYKVNDPTEYFSVRIHPESESASLPSTWPSILLGLRQFNEFLQNYKNIDNRSKSVIDEYGHDFMLTYHRNAYIFALIEACQRGEKISSETKKSIQSSLSVCAPRLEHKLSNSTKIAIINALNSSPLRTIVPWLWSTYSQIKNKA